MILQAGVGDGGQMNILGCILPPLGVDSADVCLSLMQFQDPSMLISKELYLTFLL